MEEEYVPYVAEPTEQQKQPALIINEPVQTISDQNQPPSESAVISDNEANSQSPGISKTSIKPEVTPLTKVEEPALNESEIESNFLRHIIKQRSGNFPELKRKYDSKHEHQSMIYDIISSNENTNRNKKLLQGSEWVSRNKMNNMLYENRVFYNGVEHKLLSRKKSKFNVHDDIGTKKRKLQSDHDDFDLNSIAKAEDILKPISSLKDIVTHPTIKKTFLNDKIFNDLEIQTALMIEKAKIESETLNDYVSVFLGDDPTAYLEDKIKLPEYDHHINFEKNDLNDKIYLDLDDMLRENGKDIRSEDGEDEMVEEEKAEVQEEDVQMQDGLDQLNDKIRNVEELVDEPKSVEEPVDKKEETSVVGENKEVVEPVNLESKVEEAPVEENVIPTEEPKEQPVDVEAVVPVLVEGEIAVPPAEVEADVQPPADIAVQPVQTEAAAEAPVDSATQPEPVAEATTTVAQPTEIEKVDSNDMHVVIEKTDDIIVPSAEPAQLPVAPTTADKPATNEHSTHATPPVFNSDDDDDFDPFFGLPEYEKTTLNQRLHNLSEYDPETTQQTAFSRQLTQILLQRNQEFIKNMIAIRQHFFKIERIRERLVKWGYEYSGIPEEDVEVPNVLTAVKRGLISASTNRTSVSGQGKEGYEDSGDDNEEEE